MAAILALTKAILNVRDATEHERAAVIEARQRYEDCEAYLTGLRAVKPTDDEIAFRVAQREIPAAIDDRDHAAILCKVAEGAQTRARQAAIAAVLADRAEGRTMRLRKLQAALDKARAAYLDVADFDEETETLVDGASFDRGFGFNINGWLRPKGEAL